MKIPKEKLAKVGKLFRQQIIYISQRGCNGIKCKECCLMNMCTREPAKSRDFALGVLYHINEKIQRLDPPAFF